MFEHLNTPEEIFSFKLGSALSMERDTLDMLGDLEANTNSPELKTLFHEHAEETRQQIANVEKCFLLLGEQVNDTPSPVTKGLAKEGKSTMKKTDESLVDTVILAGALETEHYEIAVYETLITNAEARGARRGREPAAGQPGTGGGRARQGEAGRSASLAHRRGCAGQADTVATKLRWYAGHTVQMAGVPPLLTVASSGPPHCCAAPTANRTIRSGHSDVS